MKLIDYVCYECRTALEDVDENEPRPKCQDCGETMKKRPWKNNKQGQNSNGNGKWGW